MASIGVRALTITRSGLLSAARQSNQVPTLTLACRKLSYAHKAPPANPDEAITFLRDGNKRFISGNIMAPNRNMERVKDLASGQKPFAAFLSCADSRVPIEIIFDQGFGDVFITRIAGNIATPELVASLEFGTAVLGSKIIYVLGHTSCGAVKATAAGAAVPGVISSLYYHISPAVALAPNDVEKATEENVKLQAKQLAVSPVLKGLVEEGKLKIFGGVYNLATGAVKEIPL
mmetsp:Transcript_21975/g.35945  ORF Transcript_21975/g.35945 Transcript_21975/m.35945 type:complete len:232 (-) Transcript_21975:47-742(-)|eukprot:CAMPEP_0184646364 /NCGR_PEP_ID=MMETSP0308-20130426/3059_1 /TAXON_ID=38269 /ORGANISM="Gloeochaete witrockiana, Strain SAG 46.84" /LENGTH=231 /DNA_ID=CAMNT_0027076317 /DNA_START=84 /DNA_END=779 /DNA_ORIENTATION=+